MKPDYSVGVYLLLFICLSIIALAILLGSIIFLHIVNQWTIVLLIIAVEVLLMLVMVIIHAKYGGDDDAE